LAFEFIVVVIHVLGALGGVGGCFWGFFCFFGGLGLVIYKKWICCGLVYVVGWGLRQLYSDAENGVERKPIPERMNKA
jgi:hypothetical protein